MCDIRIRLAAWLVVGVIGCDRRIASTPNQSGAAAPVGREPTFAYQEGGGCYGVLLFRHNQERSELLMIGAPISEKKEGVYTFDLAAPSQTTWAKINVYPRPQQSLPPLCGYRGPRESAELAVIWPAVRGKMTIERFPLDPEPKGQERTFRAKATLSGAEFRAPDGRVAKCPHEIVLDATVGWTPK